MVGAALRAVRDRISRFRSPRLEAIRKIPADRWLTLAVIAVLVVVVGLNLARAIENSLESTVFVSFRYEGRLFYQNAMKYLSNAPLWALFFITDFSTSFDAAQHPLYYFHNINAIHFFFGMVQHFTDYWGFVLLAISTALMVWAAALLFRMARRPGNIVWPLTFMALILFSPKGLLWAPQNLFIAIILFGVAAHFVLLGVFVHGQPERKHAGALFGLIFVVAMTESNAAILLCLISILYVSIGGVCSLIAGLGFRRAVGRAIHVSLLTGLPILLTRALQLGAIYRLDLQGLYFKDIEYTARLKLAGGATLPEAIRFYADNGLTFFGILGSEDVSVNIGLLYDYYLGAYSGLFPAILGLAALTVAILHRCYVFTPGLAAGRDDDASPLLAPLAGYVVCFTAATFAILFLTGRSINNIALSDWAIYDISMVFRACLLVFPALALWAALKHWQLVERTPYAKAAISGLALAAFVGIAGGNFLAVRADPLSFKQALGAVRPNSDVITNFDIGPVAIETQSRVSIAWFIDTWPTCKFVRSEKLLKMYRTAPASEKGSGETYLFLSFFPPYGYSKDMISNRFCLGYLPHSVLFEDKNFGLYRIIGPAP